MTFDRRPRMPRDLRRVMADLQTIHIPHADAMDLQPVRAQVRRQIDDAVKRGHDDDAITAAVDTYIDTFVADWRSRNYAAHSRALDALDLLEVKVLPYREGSAALHDDERSKLVDLDGAVAAAMDQLSDPDTPYLDPLPWRPRREP